MDSLRQIKLSVTNFLVCGDEYLFLHRNSHKKVDPNRLNGIGGKVDPGEDYLTAAIRETYEETGYVVQPSDCLLSGIMRLEEGYEDDWVICFFKIHVPTKTVPLGNHTDDGELMWLKSSEVLNTSYDLVDDVRYCFDEIVAGKSVFFMSCKLTPEQKVYEVSKSFIAI